MAFKPVGVDENGHFPSRVEAAIATTIASSLDNADMSKVRWVMAVGPGTTVSLPAPEQGSTVTVVATQGASGSGTLIWPTTIDWEGGIAPILPSSPIARIVTTFLGTGDRWLGFISGAFPSPGSAPDQLQNAISDLDPVGYWKLDETSGTTAADASGNGRTGVYSGAYTLASDSGYLRLSGGYVEIADNDVFSPSGGMSLFALFKHDSVMSSRQFIVSKGAANQYEWGTEIRASNLPTQGLSVDVWSPTGGPIMNTIATPPAPAKWHALTAVIPDIVLKANSTIYIDDAAPEAVTSDAQFAGPEDPFTPGTGPLRIGMRGDGVGSFVGALAHVAIFPTQLSAAQVAALMSAANNDGWIA